MKLATTLITAAFIAGSATAALAQAGGAAGGGGAGAGGAGASSGAGAGSDLSSPRKNMQRPTLNSPPVNRRGDDMAPMQGSNVSGQAFGPTYRKRIDR